MPLRNYAHVSTEHALLAMDKFPLTLLQGPTAVGCPG